MKLKSEKINITVLDEVNGTTRTCSVRLCVSTYQEKALVALALLAALGRRRDDGMRRYGAPVALLVVRDTTSAPVHTQQFKVFLPLSHKVEVRSRHLGDGGVLEKRHFSLLHQALEGSLKPCVRVCRCTPVHQRYKLYQSDNYC